MTVSFEQVLPFLLILARMTGMLVFHPIFSRTNVPTMVNAALAFVLAILLVDHVPVPNLPSPNMGLLLLWVFKEMLLGLIAGTLFRMFTAVLIVSGEQVDMQLGIAMSKAFDPGTNSSISLSAQVFNVLFTLMFFITNCHLTLIQLTALSFRVLPMGSYLIDFDAFYLIPQIFSNMFLLAAKLSLPIVAIEIITTFAVGIIMRIIPQINIFVINIQFKLAIGIFVMILLVPAFTAFMENLLALCVENIETVWSQFIP